MANIPAVSTSPISFVDGNGKQYSIPLVFIAYASGVPTVVNWPSWNGLSSALQGSITTWLGVLDAQGFITPLPPPAAGPAFTVAAVATGAVGNDITINFNSTDATTGALNVTVSTTQTYTGLNYAADAANSIEQVLGTSATNGTQPGLAYVSTAPTSAPTVTSNPVAFVIPAGGTVYEFAVPNTNGVLTASNDSTNADAGLITAAIANVNSTAGTFDLTLAWIKNVPSVTTANLTSSFAYLITVTAPPSGFGPMPATPSTITLSGGANPAATPAASASATVISG